MLMAALFFLLSLTTLQLTNLVNTSFFSGDVIYHLIYVSRMDVINKLRSTVTSVSNSLSTVLPGNPVTREYEVVRHIASAGPGLLWKIFQGVKKSTKEVTVFF